MKILKQQNILNRQSENYIAGELSNVAMVLQTPQLFVEYFSIDVDASPTVDGFKNVEDFIHEDSPIIYNRIENLPMSGIDNLISQAQFDEELGFDEDFQSSGIIFPNTIVPKPDDCFIVNGSQVPALYKVTNVSPITVRSNPFVEIEFRLFSRNTETIAQLHRQVKDDYLTTVTAIGMDKTLVIKKESYFSVEQHVSQYIDIVDMYKMLFYDGTRSAFIFDGLFDDVSGEHLRFLDITLWKLMFNEGLIVYDDVVTYAINNYKRYVEPVYISCPDLYLDDYMYKRSILYRLYTRDKKHRLDEYKFPQAYEPDPRVGKYKGKNLIYFEHYGEECDCNPMCMQCPTWDDEFVTRIANNDPYPTEEWHDGWYDGCWNQTDENGNPVMHFNPYLRNAIIAWYNGTEIDWENLVIEDKKTCENYFLIPIILAAYKQYIRELQK